MAEVKFKVRSGKNAGRVIKLPGPKFYIGRAEDCHLRPGSDQVSRHHCVVLIDGDLVTIRDFGSKNGTFLNEEQVVGERELNTGDYLRIGPLEFDVEIELVGTAPKRPKVNSIKEAAIRTVETAAAAPADKDGDVTQWLEAGETPVSSQDQTREIRDAETEEITMDQTMVTRAVIPPPPQYVPEEAAEEEEKPHAPPAKKVVGKQAAPPPKPKFGQSLAADSQSAAADTLKKLFNRR